MKSKSIFPPALVAMGLCSFLLFSACEKNNRNGGDGVGNGGDALAMDFRKVAETSLTLAENNDHDLFKLDYNNLRDTLAHAKISSTESVLSLQGVEKDAVNYPESQTILINRARFSKYDDQLLKAVLAFHEVLGLARVSDENYEKSSVLIGYDPVMKKAIMKKVDILFVVDNSGSMGNHQKNLADNIDYFLEKITEDKVNYHIGVISTSDSATFGSSKNTDGRLNHGFITPFTPDAMYHLRKNLELGTEGSAQETPYLEIQKAFTLNHPENQGFYRADAFLEIIVITDAEEQSEIDSQEFVQFLRDLKPQQPTKVSLSLFMPLPGDASCQVEDFMDYKRYYDVMTPLHGGMYNLCSSSLVMQARKISSDIQARIQE